MPMKKDISTIRMRRSQRLRDMRGLMRRRSTMNRIPRLRIARSKIGQRFKENSEAKEESEVKEYNDEDKEGDPMRRRSAGLRTKGGRGVQVGGQGVCFLRSKVGV